MISNPNTALMYYMNKFYMDRVQAKQATTAKNIKDVCKLVQDIMKEVESQEPRFISTLIETDGQWEGLYVQSVNEFEVVLYLNQMGVFNFVDDGQIPGCSVLKLSDGRKRSMSLWVEFITASGYLSARKIRSRFQTLVAQAIDKCNYRDIVKLLVDTTEVRMKIKDRYIVQITPAFRCNGIWPRSASHWPLQHSPWPMPSLVSIVKTEGFVLLSKDKSSSAEGDAWVMSFADAQQKLLHGGCRRKCLSILKLLRDRHLDLPAKPITHEHIETLLLFECEKHPRETDWIDDNIGDRVNGILLQLISCLQNRRCPHYFLPSVDLFRGKSQSALDEAAKHTWILIRELLTNPKSLETL